MNKFKKFFITLVALTIFIVPGFVLAQSNTQPSNNLMNRLSNVGTAAGYNTTGNISISVIVGLVIQALISLLGIVFIVLTILSGFKYMRANGNEEEVKKAMQSIKESVIGLVITLSAWTIWTFIFQRLISGQ